MQWVDSVFLWGFWKDMPIGCTGMQEWQMTTCMVSIAIHHNYITTHGSNDECRRDLELQSCSGTGITEPRVEWPFQSKTRRKLGDMRSPWWPCLLLQHWQGWCGSNLHYQQLEPLPHNQIPGSLARVHPFKWMRGVLLQTKWTSVSHPSLPPARDGCWTPSFCHTASEWFWGPCPL